MVPAFRLGLGRLVSNPLTGYYLVLRTRGRRSGAGRSTPVGYAILDGRVYVMAGWGPKTSWFRNALADPGVYVRLADRGFPALAEPVVNPDERTAAIRQILRNSGLMAFTEGIDPWHASDAEIMRKAERKPVIRLSRASGNVESGAFDPGGRGWFATAGLAAGIILLMVSRSRRGARRCKD